MVSTSRILNTILEDLEENYNTAIQFIQFLADTRKKKKSINSKKILAEIQDIFQNDKGWESEETGKFFPRFLILYH